MNRRLLILAAGLLAFPRLAQGAPGPPQDRPSTPGEAATGTFQQIAGQWMSAYNGPDARALAPFYLEDAQYISGHVPGLVARGRDRVVAYFEAGMRLGGHIDRLSVLSVTESCDLATVLCEYQATNAGERVQGRSLLLFRRQGAVWRIYLHMTVV